MQENYNQKDYTFLNKINEIIKENLSDERFGVSELAEEAGMSRSNLLRRIKSISGVSASQYIREIRLEKAMEILKDSDVNVSEVSYVVGFNSTSYFIKCFRDHYGYPPGEVGKNSDTQNVTHAHQLVAIMFTDIEGYTALMQSDESKALQYRNKHREIFDSSTKKYNGRILQYYGDGTLSTFSSAIDAVRCGVEMQLAFKSEPQIPVRIGIHTGDIIVTKEDIIGDGVNVASRIESLASSGSVFISDKVYDEIKNKTDISTVSVGTHALKNVKKPIEVFAISNPGLSFPESEVATVSEGSNQSERSGMFWLVILLSVILFSFVIYSTDFFGLVDRSPNITEVDPSITRKSIAVLPFINDSNDSSNIYFINGLMESTMNNLQRIKDLRVISRTSIEKYRSVPKTVPEIAQELNVKYIVAGSGQKVGDQIMLNIQLIDAQNDQQIWSQQYNREVSDIFSLQLEVSKSITDEIEVFITPEEEERISKPPTNNVIAYDLFLKGLDILYSAERKNFPKAIEYFEAAIKEDPQFARAYSGISIAYYYMDEYNVEKEYTKIINDNADRALLYDVELPQSQIAKALYYMNTGEYKLAETYFEKSLEYDPNSSLVYIFLVDLYVNRLPNTEKYLEYGLKGLELDIASYDSITKSFIFLHISNAFIQTGFVKEAEKYINKSLSYFPDNLYSQYVKAYIEYAKDRDLSLLRDNLLQVYKKDSTRMDVLQELAKSYYYLRDFPNAYDYYKRFTDIRTAYNLNIYGGEDIKIGMVYRQMGFEDQATTWFEKYKDRAENDQSIYQDLSFAMYYSVNGNSDKAIEFLRTFSEEDYYSYWLILFLDIDPLVDNIKEIPEYKVILKNLETRFWDNHEKFRKTLHEEGLI